MSVYPRSRFARVVGSALAMISGRPLSFARFHDGAAAREVKHVLATDPPDVVVLFSAQPAEYLPERLDIPVLVDLVDVDSEKWASYASGAAGLLRWVYEREHRIVRAFERRLVERDFRIALVADREAALFRRVVADVPVTVIPNGVEIGPPFSGGRRVPGRLIFTGAMDYAPNEEAATIGARSVLPLIRREIEGAHLRIVGRNPGRVVRALGDLPGVEVVGEVRSVVDELEQAEVSLLPLQVVRGIPTKVLESLAHGVPVVATKATLEAVGAEHGEHAFASDTALGLAQAAVSLLKDSALRARTALAGQAFVLERFRWDRFESGMLDLIANLAPEAART